CLIMPTLTLHAQDFTPVNILVSKFQSPKGKSGIGLGTATILGLQIWRTYSTPTLTTSLFDNANVSFSTESCPTTYAEAEALARGKSKKPHLVLWGKTSQYGEGIVVEANLLVRKAVGKSSLGTNIWSVIIP